MRKVFNSALLAVAANPRFVFLTGDLGFMALEELRSAMGERFINAGVAEQNMVSVAAGLAHGGLVPWVYSIAPFVYARPFEQIRNDVCFHNLPVRMVGNGGGYAYGPMGATHHALEDYGVMLTLPNMRAYVPAFDSDVRAIVSMLFDVRHPAYLRLGYSEVPQGEAEPAYKQWRNVLAGGGITIVAVGPLVGRLWSAFRTLDERARPSIWALTELPIAQLPEEVRGDICRSQHLMVVEEHVSHGGAGQMIATALALAGCMPRRFEQRSALGYPSHRYGSQRFHRKECGLDAGSIAQHLGLEVGSA